MEKFFVLRCLFSPLGAAETNPPIGTLNIDRASSQPTVPRPSKPIVPSNLTPAFSSLLLGSSVNTLAANQTGEILTTKRSSSPVGFLPPMLPRLPQRPTTAEGQGSVAVLRTNSLENILSGLRNRNNSDIDFVPQGFSNHSKQSSISHPSLSTNQRPKIQDRSILSSPSISTPSLPLSEQQSFSPVVESTTFPSSQIPLEKIGEAVASDDANNNADQKPVHWPKQAPTVHWITAEDGFNSMQSSKSTGDVAPAISSSP